MYNRLARDVDSGRPCIGFPIPFTHRLCRQACQTSPHMPHGPQRLLRLPADIAGVWRRGQLRTVPNERG